MAEDKVFQVYFWSLALYFVSLGVSFLYRKCCSRTDEHTGSNATSLLKWSSWSIRGGWARHWPLDLLLFYWWKTGWVTAHHTKLLQLHLEFSPSWKKYFFHRRTPCWGRNHSKQFQAKPSVFHQHTDTQHTKSLVWLAVRSSPFHPGCLRCWDEASHTSKAKTSSTRSPVNSLFYPLFRATDLLVVQRRTSWTFGGVKTTTAAAAASSRSTINIPERNFHFQLDWPSITLRKNKK